MKRALKCLKKGNFQKRRNRQFMFYWLKTCFNVIDCEIEDYLYQKDERKKKVKQLSMLLQEIDDVIKHYKNKEIL